MVPTALRQADAEVQCAPTSQEALAALNDARDGTLALVGHLDDARLEAVHSPIMSPLAWDLAHIAAYEDLWIAHRHAGMELLRPDLAAVYDAFETPRAVRSEIELLSPARAREYMAGVRERTSAALAEVGAGDGTICEMVARHELQHSETMRQTMALAGLLGPGEPDLRPVPGEDEWVEIPAGPFEMGAAEGGFAYDNERARHTVELGAFQISRRPVTNASWLRFSEGGGYERREWWSSEGWAWKEQYDITHEGSVATGDPDAPVCHVSWFEAEAFARASGARLPSEAEWEKAAGSAIGGKGEAGGGVLDGVGIVWEWTSSRFGPYPGFEAHPYREYSEVFFDGDYRVLRGGSWATSERVKTLTFRNWDLPIRRQIFAGVRLARDVA
jgi:gamma-glutamyl hercynylcysteine S-oxide synthase